jgi:hypothetical protein
VSEGTGGAGGLLPLRFTDVGAQVPRDPRDLRHRPSPAAAYYYYYYYYY